MSSKRRTHTPPLADAWWILLTAWGLVLAPAVVVAAVSGYSLPEWVLAAAGGWLGLAGVTALAAGINAVLDWWARR